MKITILTVTYNQLDKLKKLYQTLLDQKDYIKEWILYDDVSTDGTKEWMEEVAAEFKTTFINGKKREKPLVVANMNECIKAVKEGLFLLVFADTYLGEDALKNLSESYIPGSFGSAFKVNVAPDGKVISYHYKNIEGKIVSMMQTPRPWEQFSGNGMIATKEIMEGIGYIDEEYAGYGLDDYDTAMRAMMNGALLILYGNVRINHIDHPVKDTTEDNKTRLSNKINGIGYKL